MNRKKILIFSPINIFPAVSGSQQDIFNRIKIFLQNNYQVILIQFTEDSFDNNLPIKVYNLNNKNRSKLKFYKARHLESYKNIKEIHKIIEQESPDMLWFEYFAFSEIAAKIKSKFPGVKIYFRNHNYERGHLLEKWKDNFRNKKNISSIFQLLFSYFYVLNYERRMFKVATKIFFISKLDLEKYKKHFPNKISHYLPFFSRYQEIKFNFIDKKNINLFYFGSDFKNNINLSGLIYIYNNIAPKLNKNIIINILGKNIPQTFNHPQIKKVGFVEDLNEFLKDMDGSIIPITKGYGMKIKAYESFSRGFPTIITPRIHKIFQGNQESDYLVANNPQEWTEAIQKIADLELRKKMNKKILSFMSSNFSVNKINKILTSL